MGRGLSTGSLEAGAELKAEVWGHPLEFFLRAKLWGWGLGAGEPSLELREGLGGTGWAGD